MRVLPDAVPVLESAPVRLRPWRSDDAPLVVSVSSDPLVPLVTTVPASGSADEVAAYIARQQSRLADGVGYSFVIADLATDVAVGSIGLWTRDIHLGRATTGYWVGPAFRRQGYAGAALRTLTAWALGIPEVERLELYVEPANEGSCRVAESAGFEHEGLLRAWQRMGDVRRDMLVYSVIR